MSPRRHWLPLLSALALLLTPFALAPQPVAAADITYSVDTLSDTSGPTTGCVDNVADGDCSLRQALTLAGAAPAGDRKIISFDQITAGEIGGSEPWVITINSPDGRLPEIKSNTTLDADVVLTPRIIVDGNDQDVVFNITGSNNLISGLSIVGATSSGGVFRGTGIFISGSGNNVSRNYIGIRPNGTADPNFTGVRIEGASNTIGITGGPTVANYISGNTQNGVIITNSSNNVLVNNIVGLYPTSFTPFSLAARPNAQYGVQVLSTGAGLAQSNRVGGTTPALANIIGGNGQAGIQLSGTGTTSNTIQVNYIGIDRDTDTDLGNAGDGVRIEDGASNNTLGIAESPLVISGNTGYGVLIRPNGVNAPNANRITGQVFIGTNRAGTTAIRNELGGVRIDGGNAGASNNVIQGSGSSLRVAGNGGVGIQILGATARNNRVEGVVVGLTPTAAAPGSAIRANEGGGVQITNARDTTIAGNTISGNGGFGLRLSSTEGVTITANFIGLSLDRKAAQGNSGPGVDVQTSRNTLIGGPTGSTNYIAGNSGPAIALSGSGATSTFSTTIRGNLIGLLQESATTNYLARGANAGEGVRATGAVRQLTVEANSIAASADTQSPDFAAILVQGDGSGPAGALTATNAATVTVTANRIGWLPQAQGSSTAVPFPYGDGVVVSGGVRFANILTNTIRLNVGAAIRLTDAYSPTVRGNQMQRNGEGGVLAGGSSLNLRIQSNLLVENGRNGAGAVVNPAADGIFLNAGSTITGAQILSNTIRANTGRGIALQGDVNRATMRFNLLSLNGGPIRLVGSTLYPGSGADPDTQSTPNRGIDPPIVDLSFARPLSLRVNQSGIVEGYVVTSTIRTETGITPVSACITCTIQIFRPDRSVPTDNQGAELIFTVPVGGTAFRDTVPVAANGRFSARILDPLPERLLFVATDGFGNSSEYATLPLTASVVLEPVSPIAASAAPGDTVTYTLRLRNTGTLDYSNLTLGTSGTLERWAISTNPVTTTALGLRAGASALVTVTLRLPTGSDPNVAAGKRDITTFTVTSPGPPAVNASVNLETTVLPRPVISIDPRRSLGSGRPGTPVPHAFAITNNGNVTVTLDLDYFTRDAANSSVWNNLTSVNSTTLTLGPGAGARLGVSVTVPESAFQDAAATTYLTATVRPGTSPVFPGQTLYFSATTRTELNPNADLFPDVEEEGGAGGTVSLIHNVENFSNGTARFCLDYFAASQSSVRFVSATSGFVVDAQGCFTLYAADDVNPAQGRFRIAQISAEATLDRRLTRGDIETITIFLRQGSPAGESISDATVRDRIRINSGVVLPRLWLPLIRR